MQRLQFSGLTPDAAEQALAKLWCRLEEYNLPTPKITVVQDSNGTLTLALQLESAPKDEIVLRRWAEEVNEGLGRAVSRLKLQAV